VPRQEDENVCPDEKDTKGPVKPAPKGGADLEELKARLGLKKPAESAAGAKKSTAEDFRFSFGEAKGAEEKQLSPQELAAIDAEAAKASAPLARRIASLVAMLVVAVILLWLGYQFGTSMGMRVLHNEALGQAKGIREYLTKGFSDATGREMVARQDATTQFINTFEKWHEEHFALYAGLIKAFSEGAMPTDFDFEKFKKDELVPLKTMCKDFLTNVEEYSVAAILKGQLYSTELGAKLLEFVDRSNKLRARVEGLFVAIETIENYSMTGAMPGNLKPELLLLAQKAEKAKEQVVEVLTVEVAGTPELDKLLETKDVCEPVSIELEIPVCGAGKDEPQTEKRLLDTFEKRQTEVVTQFRKVKVKDPEGKPLTAKFEELFKLDMRPHLMPLLERIGSDKKSEIANLGVLISTVFQNMSDVQDAGEAVDFKDLLDSVEKLASQEQFFTL